MKNLTTLFLILFSSNLLISQFHFMDQRGWEKKQDYIKPLDYKLIKSVSPENFENGDTLTYAYRYEASGEIAVTGKAKIDNKGNREKFGTWKINYVDGSEWCSKDYLKNRLVNIEFTKSRMGELLNNGYARSTGRHKGLSGYQYIYNIKAEIIDIARYSSGYLVEMLASLDYSEAQLERIIIREFRISDDDYLEELSFPEAVEKQMEDGKLIFLIANTSWNGYTKRAYKNAISDPEIAVLIKDNFHLAYLDLEDTKPVEILIEDKEYIYNGYNGRPHELALDLMDKPKSSSPILFFLKNGNEVVYYNTGIEVDKENFLKSLRYIIDKAYLSSEYSTYMKG